MGDAQRLSVWGGDSFCAGTAEGLGTFWACGRELGRASPCWVTLGMSLAFSGLSFLRVSFSLQQSLPLREDLRDE